MLKVNCRDCIHYYITYEASMPYGCRAHGFKSRQNPSIVVKQSSGIECILFDKKPTKKEAK